MAVNETIVTGRKFRKLIDETNKLWQRISFWTKSSDVEFDDGKSAETKVGAIDGITSDLSGESENIAASIKCVNELNNNLPQFIYDSTGKITGYKTPGGADTVFPFSSGKIRIGILDELDGQVKCFTKEASTATVFCSNKILPIMVTRNCWNSAGFSMGEIWSLMLCDSLATNNTNFKAQLGDSYTSNLTVQPLSDYALSSTNVSSYTVAGTGDEIVGWRFVASGNSTNKATLKVWYVENTDPYYFDDIYVPSHAYYTCKGGATSADSQIPHSLV